MQKLSLALGTLLPTSLSGWPVLVSITRYRGLQGPIQQSGTMGTTRGPGATSVSLLGQPGWCPPLEEGLHVFRRSHGLPGERCKPWGALPGQCPPYHQRILTSKFGGHILRWDPTEGSRPPCLALLPFLSGGKLFKKKRGGSIYLRENKSEHKRGTGQREKQTPH